MYVIMGITGKVGGATARTLLRAGKNVRGIVRDKAKAAEWAKQGVELVVADSNNAKALEQAFRGSEGVFVMVPPNFTPAPGYPETQEVVTVIRRALLAAQPDRVVGLSSIGGQHDHDTGLIVQCHMLEAGLKDLPMPNAFVRAAWFFENFQWDVASAREEGKFNAFLTPLDHGFPMIATDDIGELIGTVLHETWNGARRLELEAPRRYSMLDAAATLTSLLDRPVTAIPVPRQDWADLFVKQGTPADRTAPRIEMIDGFNSGWIEFERDGTEHFLGKRTLKEVLRELLSPKA
jgi:NAD(P)H dehydrogenase (quinone)